MTRIGTLPASIALATRLRPRRARTREAITGSDRFGGWWRSGDGSHVAGGASTPEAITGSDRFGSWWRSGDTSHVAGGASTPEAITGSDRFLTMTRAGG